MRAFIEAKKLATHKQKLSKCNTYINEPKCNAKYEAKQSN